MRRTGFHLFLVLLFSAATCLLVACDPSPGPLFLEYCIPITVQENLNPAGPIPPTVGVVLDYEAHPSAPVAGSDSVKSFLIATEVPVSIIENDTVPTGKMVLQETSLAIVDSLSVDPTEPVAARVAFANLPVWAVPDATKLVPGLPLQGILGGDILRKFAARFYYRPDRQCSYFWDDTSTRWPNILLLKEQPATGNDLAEDGHAVIAYQLSGGGEFIVDNKVYDLPATRVTVQVCMNPDPFPLRPDDPTMAPAAVNGRYPVTGIDMFALVATGSPQMLTTESAFERITYQMETNGLTPAVEDVSVPLPEGVQQTQRIVNLPRMAILGGVSSSIGACAELARRRGQEYARRNPTLTNPFFRDTELSGAAVAEVDLQKEGGPNYFSVAAIRSTTSYWQGLWAETLPDVPQIDLILGHSFLSFFEFTIDYPQSRMIFRCLSYDCANAARPCCRTGGACTCPNNDPCCQLYRFKK
ncbi:hypothetical protein KJ975_06605 [Myxococcota bacterium]|nr:hypothetical protein [Myxococcota bacterium]